MSAKGTLYESIVTVVKSVNGNSSINLLVNKEGNLVFEVFPS